MRFELRCFSKRHKQYDVADHDANEIECGSELAMPKVKACHLDEINN